MNTKDKIQSKCTELRDLLFLKNKAYGDAALTPLNIFSSANSEYGLRQRIDDKLKRIQTVGLNDSTEDTLIDLAGYLILLMIARDDQQNNNIQGHKGNRGSQSYYGAASSASNKGREEQRTHFTD